MYVVRRQPLCSCFSAPFPCFLHSGLFFTPSAFLPVHLQPSHFYRLQSKVCIHTINLWRKRTGIVEPVSTYKITMCYHMRVNAALLGAKVVDPYDEKYTLHFVSSHCFRDNDDNFQISPLSGVVVTLMCLYITVLLLTDASSAILVSSIDKLSVYIRSIIVLLYKQCTNFIT